MCGATAQLSASVPGKGGREGGQEGDGETERNGGRSCFLLRTALWRNYTTAGRIIMALSAYDLFMFHIVQTLRSGERMLLALQEYREAREQLCVCAHVKGPANISAVCIMHCSVPSVSVLLSRLISCDLTAVIKEDPIFFFFFFFYLLIIFFIRVWVGLLFQADFLLRLHGSR